MNFKVPKNDWQAFFTEEFAKEYCINLFAFLQKEYQNEMVFPTQENIFKAFELCDLKDLKVVILGQDPYHGKGEAHGLSFSVPDGVKIPPSLRNIYKELESDLAIEKPANGNLTCWATQGVLLLNATLTVRENAAGSHQNRGWEVFTDTVIKYISEQKKEVVFLLWGKFAQAKATLINSEKHKILTSTHPSPFSAYRGFLGCKHFSETNAFLVQQKKSIINWKVENPQKRLF